MMSESLLLRKPVLLTFWSCTHVRLPLVAIPDLSMKHLSLRTWTSQWKPFFEYSSFKELVCTVTRTHVEESMLFPPTHHTFSHQQPWADLERSKKSLSVFYNICEHRRHCSSWKFVGLAKHLANRKNCASSASADHCSAPTESVYPNGCNNITHLADVDAFYPFLVWKSSYFTEISKFLTREDLARCEVRALSIGGPPPSLQRKCAQTRKLHLELSTQL